MEDEKNVIETVKIEEEPVKIEEEPVNSSKGFAISK